jgi:hypothetical protein
MKMNTRKALASMAVSKKLRNLADYDMDDALEVIGLRRRPSTGARFFAGLGLVLGGVAIGTALGLMMAPRAGRDMRQSMQGGAGGPRPAGSGGAYGAQPLNVGTSGTTNLS